MEAEKARASQIEEDVSFTSYPLLDAVMTVKIANAKVRKQCNQLRKELEEAHNGQTLLIEKLIHCCKEVSACD